MCLVGQVVVHKCDATVQTEEPARARQLECSRVRAEDALSSGAETRGAFRCRARKLKRTRTFGLRNAANTSAKVGILCARANTFAAMPRTPFTDNIATTSSLSSCGQGSMHLGLKKSSRAANNFVARTAKNSPKGGSDLKPMRGHAVVRVIATKASPGEAAGALVGDDEDRSATTPSRHVNLVDSQRPCELQRQKHTVMLW